MRGKRAVIVALQALDCDQRVQAYSQADACLMQAPPIIPLVAVQPTYVYIRKPYRFPKVSRFTLKPFYVGDWKIEGDGE